MLRDLVMEGSWYVVIEADETDDPRPENHYVVSVALSLIPKVEKAGDEVGLKKFHIKLEYPSAVNQTTVSSIIDQVVEGCFIGCYSFLPPRLCVTFMFNHWM